MSWSQVQEIIKVLRRAEPFPDTTAEFHGCVEGVLKAEGWRTEREVRVPNRGDGRRGYIDLVAFKGTSMVGIECDNQTARLKSLFKLRHLPCTERLILLRGWRETKVVEPAPNEIVVAGLRVTP